MSALVDFIGDDDNYAGGSVYSMASSCLLCNGSYLDVYCPPSKRARVISSFSFSGSFFEEEKTPSLDALPDECLFEIFRRLAGGQARSASACVSKRWLMLLSSIRNSEINLSKSIKSSDDLESDGYLTRCLEGKKATDVRLTAIAVGTSSRGELGKLSIRGNNSIRGVTNVGLSAISRGCPTLKVLSLWNVPSIGDEGLLEISKECHYLEKLDLSHCPLVSNEGLVAIALNSPNLYALTVESCPNIGNESLQAIAQCCPNLQCISIKGCSLVGDEGIVSLLSSAGSLLWKLNLQGLRLTDIALAVIGHYGKALTCVTLSGLQFVSEKGFWVMGNAKGLNKLSSLMISSCCGVTDLSLEAIGKGCQNLKQMSLSKCCFVSDNGLIANTRAARFLENLQLEECNRITQVGILGTLSASKLKLKSLSLVKCLGIKDLEMEGPSLLACESLCCLSIRNCPGFGSASLGMVGKMSPQLRNIDLTGLCGITDTGLIRLVESCDGLVKINLSGCYNLTDDVVSTIARLHGGTLEVMNLDGCFRVTDASLLAIVRHCLVLNDLNVSKCLITDVGVAALSREEQLNLQILSLSGCSKLSDKSIPSLIKLGKSLVGLNLQHCNSISNGAVEMLEDKLWRCDILS